MGLVRTALIFGAGYAIGHPAGRAKVAELARRPEVAQLRQKAVDTASTGVEAGKKQISKVTDKSATTPEVTAYTPADDVEPGTQPGRRARRLPSFPRRGARPSGGVTMPAMSPTAPGAAVTTPDAPVATPGKHSV
jgi:hypothetical protein